VPYRVQLAKLLKAKGMPSVALLAAGGARAIPGDLEAFGAVQPLEHLNAYSGRTIAWLASENNLEIVTQTRRRSISIDTGGLGDLAQGAKRMSVELAKTLMRQRIGYYLLSRPVQTS
jgi:hypothetical protein